MLNFYRGICWESFTVNVSCHSPFISETCKFADAVLCLMMHVDAICLDCCFVDTEWRQLVFAYGSGGDVSITI